MHAPLIELTDAPDPADVAAIRAGLSDYNTAATGIDDQRPLAVLVRDPDTHKVIGGITGRTSRGMFFLEVFFLPASLRGSGVGSEALKLAEQEGWRRGCTAALLHTNTFQAPDFYRKNGWREIASIPSGPAGNCRVIFTKQLGPVD